ncbi:MAG: hypothetical protein A2Y79_09935 [Deltaproteobacteria bacterium RBG_13_43_22]|nr:MAG: hypothetical protein A2Y79_09935 [Deltaproteobacteria bacterium RBG_13_43_22]
MEVTIQENLQRNYINHPSKIFIQSKNESLTYGDVYQYVNGIANSLNSLGIRKNDKIGLLMNRIPELVLSILSISKVAALAVPINILNKPEEIKEFIFDISPSLLIIQDKYLPLLDKEISSSSIKIIVIGETNHPYIPWKIICYPFESISKEDIDQDNIAYLNYTSGSSGNPKGAITTHANIYWNTMAAVEKLKIHPGDIHLCMFASFAHPHEIFARALYTGGTLVLLEEINPKTIAGMIKKRSVTCMMGLAPMYEMMAAHCQGSDLESLRIAESGGMYTQDSIIKEFKNKFAIPVLPVWGSTETTGIAIANSPAEEVRYGSIGRPCHYYEVAIVDDSGKEVPTNSIGELIFKGPAVVSGYLDSPEEKAKSFKRDWYYSGDLAKKDPDGYFYFEGRKNEMIKTGGLKIFPQEVENILITHPMIRDVAVIGLRDKLRGEVVKAIIVLNDGTRISPGELIHYCQERIPRYKAPRIIEFRDVLPKTGGGKINKKELKRDAE